MLVKHAGVHEGHWQILVEFGLGAANMPIAGPDGFELKPAAVIPVNTIGIQKFDEPTPISVDAAVVNPLVPAPEKRSRSKKLESA